MRAFLRKLIVCIPFILGIVVYVNTLGHAFVYDDHYFTDVEKLHGWSGVIESFKMPYNTSAPAGGIYRPLPMATFAVTYALFGSSPLPFHLGNILLFAGSCSLLFVLLRYSLKLNEWVSVSTSMIFAVLPIHTEVVANVKSRDELLSVFFFFIMWIAYEYGRKKSWGYVMSSVCFLLSLLSKETAIVFPLIVVAWAKIARQDSWKDIGIRLLWYIPAVGAYTLLRSSAAMTAIPMNGSAPLETTPMLYLSLSQRIFSVLQILGIYLEKIFFPVSLSASYHYASYVPIQNALSQLTWIPGVLCVVGILGLLLKRHEKKDGFGLGIVIFIVTYLPISQLILPILPGSDAIAERWVYLSSLGAILVVVTIFYDLLRYKKNYFWTGILIVTFLYGTRTVFRNRVWANATTLYGSMVQDAPRSYRGHELLGIEYMYNGEFAKAKEEANMALTIYPTSKVAINLDKSISFFANNRAMLYQTLGERGEDDTKNGDIYRQKRQSLIDQGAYAQALEYAGHILRGNTSYSYNDVEQFVYILIKLKKYTEAQQWIQAFTLNDQKRPDVQFLLAVILYKSGEEEEAMNLRWDKTLSNKERRNKIESF